MYNSAENTLLAISTYSIQCICNLFCDPVYEKLKILMLFFYEKCILCMQKEAPQTGILKNG